MKRVFWLVILVAGLSLILVSCGSNVFKSVSDENSEEACRYKTTQHLDTGNYDAVLSSTCADSMQKGAAYFGNAGYDIKDVINNLSKAQDKTDPLTLYMSSLTGIITDSTLTDIDNAKVEYCNEIGGTINSTTQQCTGGDTNLPLYKDAQFYISLVDSVKSLSLMKVIMDDDGDGKLSTCDININTVPDDADAAACALNASGSTNPTSGSCGTWASYSATTNITFTGTGKSGTYRGLTITIAGTPTLTCLATYKKLLYRDSTTGIFWVATTTSNMCSGSDGNQWPCPVEQKGTPLDFVTTLDTSLTNAINSLGNAIPVTVGTDVQESIQEIKNDACCTTGEAKPCTCTSSEISKYLQTIQK